MPKHDGANNNTDIMLPPSAAATPMPLLSRDDVLININRSDSDENHFSTDEIINPQITFNAGQVVASSGVPTATDGEKFFNSFDPSNPLNTQSWDNLTGIPMAPNGDSITTNNSSVPQFDFGPPLSPGFSSDWDLSSVNGGMAASDQASIGNFGLNHQNSVGSSLNQLVNENYSNNIFSTSTRPRNDLGKRASMRKSRSFLNDQTNISNSNGNGNGNSNAEKRVLKVGEVNVPLDEYISPAGSIKNDGINPTANSTSVNISNAIDRGNAANDNAGSVVTPDNAVVETGIISENNKHNVLQNQAFSDIPLPFDSVGHGLLDLFSGSGKSETKNVVNNNDNINNNINNINSPDINNIANFTERSAINGPVQVSNKRDSVPPKYDFLVESSGDDQLLSLFELENMYPLGEVPGGGSGSGSGAGGAGGIINDSEVGGLFSDKTNNGINTKNANSNIKSNVNGISNNSPSDTAGSPNLLNGGSNNINKNRLNVTAINSSVMNQVPKAFSNNSHYKKEPSSNRSSVVSGTYPYGGASSQHSLSQVHLPTANVHHHGHHTHHHYHTNHDPYSIRHSNNLHGVNKAQSVGSPGSRPPLLSNNSSDSISSFMTHNNNTNNISISNPNPSFNKLHHLHNQNLIGGGHVGISLNNNHNSMNHGYFNNSNHSATTFSANGDNTGGAHPGPAEPKQNHSQNHPLSFDEDATSIKSINSFDPFYFDLPDKFT